MSDELNLFEIKTISVKIFGKWYDSILSASKDLVIPYSTALKLLNLGSDMELNILSYMIRYINKNSLDVIINERVENGFLMQLKVV